MYVAYVKRIVDFILAFCGILILSPLFLIIIFLLYVFQSKKVLFIQKRVGLNKVVFQIFKFKTMNDSLNAEGFLKSDKERLTLIGTFLRKTSLDELPQLFNVIKGDMSLVGPRPLLTNYMHRYSDFQDKRHLVKPGITGYVQIKGRNSLPWDKRFELDVLYVENCSFSTDCKILFLTVFQIFNFKTTIPSNHIPIEPFEL